MGGSTNFLAGFMNSFGNAAQAQQDRQQKKQFTDLQVKAFKTKLEADQAKEEYKRKLVNQMSPFEQPPAELGGGPEKPGQSVTQVLADPQGQINALMSGIFSPKDIGLTEQRTMFQNILGQINGGGGAGFAGTGGTGGAIGGIAIDPLSKLQAIAGQDMSKLSEDPASKVMRTPLSTTDLLRYEDAKGNPPPAGTTLNDIRAQGYKPVSTQKQAASMKTAGALAVIKKMEPLVNQLFTKTTVGERIKGKGEALKQKFTQENPNFVMYESLKNGMKAMIIKALGESGNLAEGDYERIDPLFPETGTKGMALPDSREVAKMKMKQIRSILEQVSQGKSLDQSIAGAQAKSGAAGFKLPQGVDPELINFMTPEERKLFQ